jgi:hypothetical protein
LRTQGLAQTFCQIVRLMCRDTDMPQWLNFVGEKYRIGH